MVKIHRRYRDMHTTSGLGIALLILVSASTALVSPRDAHAQGDVETVFVGQPVTPYVLEEDLRDLPGVLAPWQPGDPVQVAPIMESTALATQIVRSAKAAPEERRRSEHSSPPAIDERASPLSPKAVSGSNFEGIGATGIIPPDTNGDVGPNHYIQTVNNSFQVFDKTGTPLVAPLQIHTLWSGTSTDCAEPGFDPVVLYDHLADRWLISQVGTLGSGNPFIVQCIAVSQTSNPVTGGWYLYDYPTGGVINDYSKLAVWPDAYYMGSQRGYPSAGSDAWAFERDQMLVGGPAAFIRFFNPGHFMLPSDLDGATAPPPGAPSVYARVVDGAQLGGVDRLELYEFHVDWATPAFSTFTALPIVPTAPFDRAMCGGYNLLGPCIPMPGTSQRLEPHTAFLMWRLQYRNFGSHQVLLTNHTVDVDGTNQAGIRWYEVRKAGGGGWAVYQQGTYSPDADHRWMGSIAMDGSGNIALGYSVASASTFPSIRYTGRSAADPLGVMTVPETSIVAGSGSQTHTTGRWGDYSSMSVDPTNDFSFWYTQQYYATTSDADWRTRIASFLIGDWVVSSNLTITGTISVPGNVIVENDATLTIASGAVLDMDLAQFHLLVRSGSRVIVKSGGRID